MFLSLGFVFLAILFLYVAFGNFNTQKLQRTNALFCMYFLTNVFLWIQGFWPGIEGYVWGMHLFHIGAIESFFLILFGMVGIGVSIYSNYYFEEYLHHWKNLNFYYSMIFLFVVAMQIIIVGSNAMVFLVMWEVMTLSSYFLVIHEYEENASLEWGNYYLVIAHVGMFFILLGFIPFIIASSSFDFANWSGVMLTPEQRNIAFFAALIGFGAKAGIWPLDIWLPKAHPIASSNVSALMSGFMVKLPIMMILKFIVVFFAMQVDLVWGITLLIAGSLSAFLGIFYAMTQNDIKRVLAFSTIENVWFILANIGVFAIGLALWNPLIVSLGLLALLYHSANHAFYKTLMFLIAGSIIERTGTRSIAKMGGLVKVLPFLSIITMFGVLTISGVPPFASFNSELAGIMGMLKIITDADGSVLRFITIGCVVLIALMSVFAFVSFVRLYSIVFSGRPRDLDLKVRVESHLSENASYVFFVVAIFVVSLFPGLFSHIASTIIGGSSTVPLIQLQIGDFEFIPAYLILVYALLGVIVYALSRFFLGSLTKAVPWNCGYPTIPHRSQYSSRSLVQPIRRLYEGLYMQASDLSYNEYYKKDRNTLKFLKRKAYFTNIGYLKCIRGIQYLWDKVRSLQNGVLQYYIGYLFGTLMLMLLVLYYFL